MINWSIISSAAGTMPLAMIPETASLASPTLANTPSSVRQASGARTSRSVAAVTSPKVPSAPITRPRRSYPGTSSMPPPSSIVSPLGSTSSTPSTWFVVTPYFSVCGPPEFVATFPPMVQADWLDGSGA